MNTTTSDGVAGGGGGGESAGGGGGSEQQQQLPSEEKMSHLDDVEGAVERSNDGVEPDVKFPDDDVDVDVDDEGASAPPSKPSRLSRGFGPGAAGGSGDDDHNNNNNKKKKKNGNNPNVRDDVYGAVIPSATKGNFPSPGGILGPYFSVGRLGKGTFASIHQCINLAYYHRQKTSKGDEQQQQQQETDDDNDDVNSSSELPRLPKCAQLNPRRLAAAKVEVDNFNVLDGESGILEYLAESMPAGSVPMYMGHLRSSIADNTNKNDDASSVVHQPVDAMFMEYFPGRDMGQIRDWWTKRMQQPNSSERKRRLSVKDAVHLCSKVLLPLLKSMHEVGLVHRDVKPSNVVKRDGRSSTSDDFALVDFGLSRQITASHNMPDKDVDHPWNGKSWMCPRASRAGKKGGRGDNSSSSDDITTIRHKNTDGTPKVYYRKERPKAEFRGTSMYASPLVHQLRDFCARDDVWSLMYVFCDLVAGGLPWMEFAARRRRDDCQTFKERIHGMTPSTGGDSKVGSSKSDHSQLLMGSDYFIALNKRYRGEMDPPADGPDESITVPPPLEMSKDYRKIMALDQAFEHLGGLGFTDVPDYETIQISMEQFLIDDGVSAAAKEEQNQAPGIDWDLAVQQFLSNNKGGMGNLDESDRPKDQPLWGGSSKVPTWEFQTKSSVRGCSDNDLDQDPVDWLMFAEAEENHRDEEKSTLRGEEADLARLPLEMRFRIAQMEFNTQHSTTIEPHLALRDWLRVALPLLNGEWDSKRFEKGGHRSIDDGYRREFFERLIGKCLDCSDKFNGFRDKRCYFHGDEEVDENKNVEQGEAVVPAQKRRKVITTGVSEPRTGSAKGLDLVLISKVIFDLKMTKKMEEKLSRAPPPRLSFGGF